MDKEIFLIRLYSISFPVLDRLLQKIVDLRIQDTIPDTLWAFSYEPCLSVGSKSFNEDDLLKPLDYFKSQGIFLYQATRGGGLTYYWPGQLLLYPVIKLQPGERNIPQYMYNLEEVALRTLGDFGIEAMRKRDQAAEIGLWVNDKSKIASTGIRISRWVTSYGMALNLDGDHSPSQYIRPCGLEGVSLVTIAEQTGQDPGRDRVLERYSSHFQDVFDKQVLPAKQHTDLNSILNPLLSENQRLMEFS